MPDGTLRRFRKLVSNSSRYDHSTMPVFNLGLGVDACIMLMTLSTGQTIGLFKK